MIPTRFKIRNNWQKSIAQYGYLDAVLNNPQEPYWVEQLSEPFCFEFTESEIDAIYKATRALYQLCLKMVDIICTDPNSNQYFQKLKIPAPFWDLIRQSWLRENPEDLPLYGRFDLVFNQGQIKALEFNADTPTLLWESVYQWVWLEDLKATGQLSEVANQFNFIDLSLETRFKTIAQEYNLYDKELHFVVMRDSPEDEDTVLFMMGIAQKIGISTQLVYLDEFGIDEAGYPCDSNSQPIYCFFKLYPWENLFIEIEEKKCWSLIDRLLSGEIKVIEPPWKAILSNKGIWALLWQQFPQSRYLLPSFFEDENSPGIEQLRSSIHIRKPLIGREGASVSLIDPLAGTLLSQESDYGEEGYILQEFCPPAEAMGYYPIIGSWFIDDACGMGIRCDRSLITSNSSIFVPHYYI